MFRHPSMHLLYPSDPIRAKKCDDFYAAESTAVQAAGFEASVFSFEEFQGGLFRPSPTLPANVTVLYRGWMMSSSEYVAFETAISGCGAVAATNSSAYLSTHYLPNWYPIIREFTPETRIFAADADLVAELRVLEWDQFFIKDYVKSLKTSTGSRISTPEQAAAVVSEMRRFLGCIEGGLCVRRIEQFLPQTEKRFFVINSVPCSMDGEVPSIVTECARRIKSHFFSVDVVQRADGDLRIVEIGDGQVSDLVGWTPDRFAEVLSRHYR